MNTLFNTALKQSTSLSRDLSSPNNPLTPSHLGQISASLTAFSRTLDSYTSLSRTELNPTKKEKALERIASFRTDLSSYRDQYAALKREAEEVETAAQRTELLGRRPHHANTPDNPYAHASTPQVSQWAPSSSNPNSSYNSNATFGAQDPTRESHALREQSFFSNTHSALDEYLARGQAVLGDLGQQREILKGTQKRLYSVAGTLGVSGDTIKMIERRARQDKWVFGVGVVVFFGFCWAVMHFLG